MRIPVDPRSLILVISVHSISNLQYRRQSLYFFLSKPSANPVLHILRNLEEVTRISEGDYRIPFSLSSGVRKSAKSFDILRGASHVSGALFESDGLIGYYSWKPFAVSFGNLLVRVLV